MSQQPMTSSVESLERNSVQNLCSCGKKTRKMTDAKGNVTSEVPGWLRRLRLVAREYNWLDVRDDVYSPSSNSAIVKLLPALALTDGFIRKLCPWNVGHWGCIPAGEPANASCCQARQE